MTTRLLTIIIPTYNRAACLALLLDRLLEEIVGLEEQVRIIVADNASTDATSEISTQFHDKFAAANVIRWPENLGADESCCRCVEGDDSTFFWIIGDDDLPKKGMLAKLTSMLAIHSPDLIHLSSTWVTSIDEILQSEGIEEMEFRHETRLGFSRKVNIWTTFLSGMVVNRSSMLAHTDFQKIRSLKGSSLVQLGWILPVLYGGKKFINVQTPCVIATSGNSGGYSVLTVFGQNFPRIVNSTLGLNSIEARAIIHRTASGFLPSLIWKLRFAHAGKFNLEPFSVATLQDLRPFAAYWVFLYPMLRLPKVWCAPVLALSRLLAICQRTRDKW